MPARGKLRLLVGSAGTGKTARLIKVFRRQLERPSSELDRPSFFIVPTQEHQERVLSLLFREREVQGFTGPRVMTINDFIRFKSKTTGRRTLSQFERVWIVRDLLSGSNWQWIRKDTLTLGLVHVFADFIREAKHAGFSADAWERACAGRRPRSALLDLKLKDLARLMKHYDALLESRGWTDPEEEIRAFAARRSRGGPRDILDCVIVDGFYHFTALQMAFFERIFASSRQAWVALTLRGDSEKLMSFRYPQDTRRRLLGMGFQEMRLGRVRRCRGRGDLEHLEKYLFAPARVKYAAHARNITVFAASSLRQEVEMIARAILKHYRGGPYHFSDFMIVMRHIGAHRSLIEEIFDALGLPYEIHERKRLGENIRIRFLLKWMNCFRPGASFGRGEGAGHFTELVEFIRAGLSGVAVSEADEIERSATSWNPGVYPSISDMAERLGREALSSGARASLQRVLNEVERYLAISRPDEFRSFYAEFVKRHGVSPSVKPFSYDDRRALDAFLEMLQTETESLGASDSFDVRSMTERLVSDLEMGLYSLSHRDKNRVQVYDVSLVMQKEYRVVFVSGLAEDMFPPRAFQDPVLKDEEREYLDGRSLRLDTTRTRSDGERYYFYIAVTRAREKLFLTFASRDASGREVSPSFYIRASEDCFKKPLPRRSRGPGDILPPLEDTRVPQDWMRLLSYEATRRKVSDVFKDSCFLVTHQVSSAVPSLALWLRRLEEMSRECRLRDTRVLREIHDENRIFSATELEVLSNCGYQHFAGHVLRIQDKERLTGWLQDGRIVHRVLEEVYREAFLGRRFPLGTVPKGDSPQRGQSPWDPEDLAARLLDRLKQVFAEFPVEGERPFRTEIRRMRLERILRQFARFECEQRALYPGWRAAKLEFGFGLRNPDAGDPGPLRVRNGGPEALIRGKIDRIDLDHDNQKAMVIDYKAGASFRLQDIEEGRQMQIPIYILAARELLGLNVVGAEFLSYTRLQRRGLVRSGYYPDAVARKQRVLEPASFDEMLERSRHKIIETVRKFREGDIRPRSRTCEHCGYYGMCRYEHWKVRR